MSKNSLCKDAQGPRQDPARHDHIKRSLKAAGSSIRELSAEIGVAASTLTIVSQGYRTSHRVQNGIAQKLGMKAEELFPERYEKGGE